MRNKSQLNYWMNDLKKEKKKKTTNKKKKKKKEELMLLNCGVGEDS